ncbi:NYN domain-containing protein [Aliiglaciecola sp. LCG003]|uniref:NYN domain-containing protein n=1 Tax=Aliiglaciecola sp. LCG003 TaxID=3053655 RepID=UPI002573BE89|nr:NYN domain-containing protein [Aliiglaciecola sp. LCG003]WJG08049.1 NYN domain-containing protein [Aliiglaciecola sp. LCG003]
MQNIGIFVDVQNIYYTCRDAYQGSFNYRKLWQNISQQGVITNAIAYAIAPQNDSQIKFQDALRHIGFAVKTKPFIQRQDGSAKGDWDVGITIDIMEASANLNKVILCSGDGDFSMLLAHIKAKHNCSTEVYGVPSLTAKALIDHCDSFIKIDSSLLQ